MASSIATAQPQLRDLDVNFRNGLEEFKTQLESLEVQIAPDQVPHKGDSNHQQVLAAFERSQDICRDFETEHSDDPDYVRTAQSIFRSETDPWLTLSWIGNRARSKPSGFAGDYEMLVKLYDEATPARGLGGYIDLCILDLPLARAVRARLAAARNFLLQEIASRDGGVRILDIASGPCREYLNWPNLGDQPLEIVAMDNDPVALDYVGNHVAPGLQAPTSLRPQRYNALRTRSAENTIRNFGRFDIIYSVGLCDYLTDNHLVGLLKAWRETLTENGVLYIAFKDTLEYDKTPYQWHLDWFFYQRTQQDVLSLYEQAGFDVEALEITRDATNIIINFIDRHVPGKITRVDSGEGMAIPKGVPAQRTVAKENASQ